MLFGPSFYPAALDQATVYSSGVHFLEALGWQDPRDVRYTNPECWQNEVYGQDSLVNE